MNRKLFLTTFLGLLLPLMAMAQVNLNFNLGLRGPQIYEDYYGIFFEELSHAGEGGLYAELIQNRSFEDDSSTPLHWTPVGQATQSLTTSNMMNAVQKQALQVKTVAAGDGVRNDGFWGIAVVSGETYKLSFWIRSDVGYQGNVTAMLLDGARNAIGQTDVSVYAVPEWRKYTATITATGTTPAGYFDLRFDGAAEVTLDMVSLFPPTFNNRENGFRRDMAQMLADIKPTFMRFPGGCYIEGTWDANLQSDCRYLWKNSVGPQEERTQLWNNRWGYMVTNGQGIYEYLQYCEDIGAIPMYVVNIGVGHDWAHNYLDLDEYIQETLDLIEYCNGDVTTTWGAKRAAAGHPAPFNLKYIEIGNENYTFDHYAERYIQFYNAIKEKDPEIICIGNDPCWGTDFPKWGLAHPVDLVDEHYYRTPEWFINSYDHFDGYSRTEPKVYVGEWAASEKKGKLGNMNAALGEAIFMCGAENNSDMVKMLSFSEPIAHVSDTRWPAMIYHNAEKAVGTPSYYAQRMYGQNIGKQNVKWTEQNNGGELHAVGVGTWSTSAEFYNIKVTDEQGNVLVDGASTSSADWENEPGTGQWSVENGVVANATDAGTRSTYTLKAPLQTDCFTYTMKARKISGNEGFLILLDFKDVNNYAWWAIGGWGNKQHGVEQCVGGSKSWPVSNISGSVTTGQEYDIKVVRKQLHVQCYLDGTLMFEFDLKNPSLQSVYVSSNINDETGDFFVKMVNPHATANTVHLTFDNGRAVSGTAEVMNSANNTDENTFDNPEAIVPHNESVTINPDGTIDFETKPYSINILRLKVEDVVMESLIPEINQQIAAAEAIKQEAVTTVLWNNLQEAVNEGKAVTETTPYETQEQVLAKLKEAVNAAQAVDVTILRQTIALAKEEGKVEQVPYANESLEKAEDYLANGTTSGGMTQILTALRNARRLAALQRDEHSYPGHTPTAGKFYLYNVGQKAYLTNGADWGTHAVVGYPGNEATLTANGAGFTIQFEELTSSGKYLAHILQSGMNKTFLDVAAGSALTCVFEDAGDGSYYIKTVNGNPANAYLCFDGNTTTEFAYNYRHNVVNRLPEKNGDNAKWKLVTREERMAQLDEASQDNPVDASLAFINPSLNKFMGGWAGISQNFLGYYMDSGDFNTEIWDKRSNAYDFYQTITVPKAGVYDVKVQAYYRHGDPNNHMTALAAGTLPETPAVFYVGQAGEAVYASTPVRYIHEAAGKCPGEAGDNTEFGTMPNHPRDDQAFFGNGYYWNTLRIVVPEDNYQLRVGIYKDAAEAWPASSRVDADNFRLVYYGPAPMEVALTNGFATFSADQATQITTTDVSAYQAVKQLDDKIVLSQLAGIIPANTGVVLYGEGQTTATLAKTAQAAADDFSANMLRPHVEAGVVPVEADGYKNYLLAKDESETSCVFRPSSGNGIVDANRAYLVQPSDADSKDYLIVFDDDPTGINAINGSLQRGGDKTVYDLQGRKIAGTPSSKKGVYIVGGKKIVIK